jgi:RNA-directed DNA polymerase
MTREANAGGRKAAGNRDNRRPLRRQSRITGRIGRCPTRKGADAGQVSLCSDDDDDPEPKDKLDAMTTTATAMPDAVVVVNGPEDDLLDWDAIDWRTAEDDVRRLRQRIFTASQAGDLKRVRNLQKLMLRSRANTLLSVRRVTERNAGRKTAGVDGKVVLLPAAKVELVDWVQHNTEPWQARPVKRVYIPKRGSTGKRRPLGIPVIVDRCLQARVVNALEPEWEARFEPRSYGFRPGRGCHDAIDAIFHVARGANPRRRWALDADLAAAFDRIDHDYLLGQLGTFPARGLIAGWLNLDPWTNDLVTRRGNYESAL